MAKTNTGQNAGTTQEDATGAAGGNGAGTSGQQQSVEELLEADADDDNDGAQGTGGDGDGEGEGDESDVAAAVRKAMEAFLPTIKDQTTREIDRRVNSALSKVRGKAKAKDDDEDDNDADGADKGGKAPRLAQADIRGARIAFREYLPDEIRFLSTEEKAMATEFGLVQLKAAAAAGFDDEDEAGKEVAKATAAFIKKARVYYSGRTKKALEKQGAIRKDGTGQNAYGTQLPGSTQTAFERAKAKDRELFPERYANENKK